MIMTNAHLPFFSYAQETVIRKLILAGKTNSEIAMATGISTTSIARLKEQLFDTVRQQRSAFTTAIESDYPDIHEAHHKRLKLDE